MSGAGRGVRERCPEAAGLGAPIGSLHPFEATALSVARGFFRGFADPPSQGWMGAFAAARVAFAPEVGPAAALAVLDVVGALRGTRRSAFRFSNPACPCCAERLTEHERQLMAALRAVREDRLDAARAHAMLLLEGGDSALLLGAMAMLVRVGAGGPVAAEAGP